VTVRDVLPDPIMESIAMGVNVSDREAHRHDLTMARPVIVVSVMDQA